MNFQILNVRDFASVLTTWQHGVAVSCPLKGIQLPSSQLLSFQAIRSASHRGGPIEVVPQRWSHRDTQKRLNSLATTSDSL